MWIASFRTSTGVQLVLLALWITYVLLAAGEWTHMTLITRIGGYTGLVTAVIAFYVSAAEVINETYGHTVLPIGPRTHTSHA
jgi:succinate-acetate transporter protein